MFNSQASSNGFLGSDSQLNDGRMPGGISDDDELLVMDSAPTQPPAALYESAFSADMFPNYADYEAQPVPPDFDFDEESELLFMTQAEEEMATLRQQHEMDALIARSMIVSDLSVSPQLASIGGALGNKEPSGSTAGRKHPASGDYGLENAHKRLKVSSTQSVAQDSSISAIYIPRAVKKDYTKVPVGAENILLATTFSGNVLYFTRTLADRTCTAKEPFESAVEKSINRPIYQMLATIEASLANAPVESPKAIATSSTVGDVEASDKDLWVHKYRPRRFLDLLSSPATNKEILRWIKEWDKCVFGRKSLSFSSHVNTVANIRMKVDAVIDPLGRPEKRILLLNGPPGLGKTTLVHIAAKQAGYDVIEVNASDDRTGKVLDERVKSIVLGQKSIRGNDHPQLLIIDEIDGVSGTGGDRGFIQQLIGLASKEEGKKFQRGKKKAHTGGSLVRPIICICNDLYAPVLRELKEVAQIVKMDRFAPSVLTDRLREISTKENMRVDEQALSWLAETTQCDLRASLNTLQFSKRRGITALTTDALRESALGIMDTEQTPYSVWYAVFQSMNARKKRKLANAESIIGTTELAKHLHRTIGMINANGDHDKFVQGCFENYLSVKYHDVLLQKPAQASEWFYLHDQLVKAEYSGIGSMAHQLWSYRAYPIVAMHLLFAGSVKQTIQYPRMDFECFQATKSRMSEFADAYSRWSLTCRVALRVRNAYTETLPWLVRVLSPDIRSANAQLIKKEEKPMLARLVELMIALGLRYEQDRGEDGQFSYRLHPYATILQQCLRCMHFSPLDGVVLFEGASKTLPSRYAVRQLIAQEIEAELVRRHEESLPPEADAPRKKRDVDASASTHVAKDFFGRPITVHKCDGSLTTTKPRQPKVRYVFSEGYSNAVRKPLPIRSLL